MKAHSSLIYYKRHSIKCPLRGDESAAECDCTVWVMGVTPTGYRFPRTSTKASTMPLAEQFVAKQTAAHVSRTPALAALGDTLDSACDDFLRSKQDKISDDVYNSFARLLIRFKDYCYAHGVSYIKKVTVKLVEKFRDEKLAKSTNTRIGQVNRIRHFLKFCYRRELIDKDVATQIEHEREVHEPAAPFTDDEISRMLKRAGTLKGNTPFGYHPETFRLLLELMLTTGMRVGDAVVYEPHRVKEGQYNLRYRYEPQKQVKNRTKKLATVYPPKSLHERILNCHWLTPTQPFQPRPGEDIKNTGIMVHRQMKRLGRKLKIADCRPHRMRDTFAVRQLLNGATLDEVSALLNHASVVMTQKYYARWTEDRESLLEKRLAARQVLSECAV